MPFRLKIVVIFFISLLLFDIFVFSKEGLDATRVEKFFFHMYYTIVNLNYYSIFLILSISIALFFIFDERSDQFTINDFYLFISFFIFSIIIVFTGIPVLTYLIRLNHAEHSCTYIKQASSSLFIGGVISFFYETLQRKFKRLLNCEKLNNVENFNSLCKAWKYQFLIYLFLLLLVIISFMGNDFFKPLSNMILVYGLYGGFIGTELATYFYNSDAYKKIKNFSNDKKDPPCPNVPT